jgi:hypothetical protein
VAVRSPELTALIHIADSLADRAGYAWTSVRVHRSLSAFAWESIEPERSRREALLEGLEDVVVRETERERELFAEFRRGQEEEAWRSQPRV